MKMHHFRFKKWICLVGLLHLLGRQVTAKTSADLWFRPLTSYSVAGEYAGAFGTVCETIGVVLPQLFFWVAIFF